MARYRKTERRRAVTKPATYRRRRRPGEPRVRDLLRMPWWADPVVIHILERENAMSIDAAFYGVLARDLERKTSKAGKPYLKLNIRVGAGDTGQWVSCLVFDDIEVLAAKLTKDCKVYIEGGVSADAWLGKDGKPRAGLSCMARFVRLPAIGTNKPPREHRGDDRPDDAMRF